VGWLALYGIPNFIAVEQRVKVAKVLRGSDQLGQVKREASCGISGSLPSSA
jgi:hypothetical protein